jgi:hypothetical protein
MATKKIGAVKSGRIVIESPFKAKGLYDEKGVPVKNESKAILKIKKAVAQILGFSTAEVKPRKNITVIGANKKPYTRDFYPGGSYRQKSFTVVFAGKGVSLPGSGATKGSTTNKLFKSVSFGVPAQVSVSDVLEYFRAKGDPKIAGVRTPAGKLYRFNSSADK